MARTVSTFQTLAGNNRPSPSNGLHRRLDRAEGSELLPHFDSVPALPSSAPHQRLGCAPGEIGSDNIHPLPPSAPCQRLGCAEAGIPPTSRSTLPWPSSVSRPQFDHAQLLWAYWRVGMKSPLRPIIGTERQEQ